MWKKAREIGEKCQGVRVARQRKVSSRLEKVGIWEKKMEKILDRIREKKYVKGKKEKEKQGDGFLVTLSLGLTIY